MTLNLSAGKIPTISGGSFATTADSAPPYPPWMNSTGWPLPLTS